MIQTHLTFLGLPVVRYTTGGSLQSYNGQFGDMTRCLLFLLLLLGVCRAENSASAAPSSTRYTWLLENKEMNLKHIQMRFLQSGHEELRRLEAEFKERSQPILEKHKAQYDAFESARKERRSDTKQLYDAYAAAIEPDLKPLRDEYKQREDAIIKGARFNSNVTLNATQRGEFERAWSAMTAKRDVLYALPGESDGPSEHWGRKWERIKSLEEEWKRTFNGMADTIHPSK